MEKVIGPPPTRKAKEAATNARLLHQRKKEGSFLPSAHMGFIGIREQFRIQKTLTTPPLRGRWSCQGVKSRGPEKVSFLEKSSYGELFVFIFVSIFVVVFISVFFVFVCVFALALSENAAEQEQKPAFLSGRSIIGGQLSLIDFFVPTKPHSLLLPLFFKTKFPTVGVCL